jgi:hypothetical protein
MDARTPATRGAASSTSTFRPQLGQPRNPTRHQERLQTIATFLCSVVATAQCPNLNCNWRLVHSGSFESLEGFLVDISTHYCCDRCVRKNVQLSFTV